MAAGIGRGQMSATWRGVLLLLRASPVAAPCMFLIDALAGLVPSVVAATSAVLIDQAQHVLASGEARRSVAIALAVITAALLVERTWQATLQMLTNLTTF